MWTVHFVQHTRSKVSDVNLGFDKLYEVSSALTEKLRAKELDGTDVMI